MSKEFSLANKGTCSKQTNFVLNDDHTIASVSYTHLLNANLEDILHACEEDVQKPVSYTHLDVYKRQTLARAALASLTA